APDRTRCPDRYGLFVHSTLFPQLTQASRSVFASRIASRVPTAPSEFAPATSRPVRLSGLAAPAGPRTPASGCFGEDGLLSEGLRRSASRPRRSRRDVPRPPSQSVPVRVWGEALTVDA